MTKSSAHHRKKKSAVRVRPVTRDDAAGIDLGATIHYVAVPPERDPQPVRSFGAYTGDLHALADWLIACKITTGDGSDRRLLGAVVPDSGGAPASRSVWSTLGA